MTNRKKEMFFGSAIWDSATEVRYRKKLRAHVANQIAGKPRIPTAHDR